MGSYFVQRPDRGFTLLELMMVIALAAVILAIGAPSFAEFRRNARLTAPANDFLAATQLARTEAVKRQTSVAICQSASAGAPNPTCDGTDFTGWIVFVDQDRNCVRAANEPLLTGEARVNSGSESDSFRVTARAENGRNCVLMARTGFIDDAAVVPSVTRLLFCDARGIAALGSGNNSAARGIVVEPNGRARVTRDAAVIAAWGFGCP
jgi:type IV fimbrial biogenesis protein FimT